MCCRPYPFDVPKKAPDLTCSIRLRAGGWGLGWDCNCVCVSILQYVVSLRKSHCKKRLAGKTANFFQRSAPAPFMGVLRLPDV